MSSSGMLRTEGEPVTMSQTDPDFHQRLVGSVERDRMVGQADASEDHGATWRKDFDLVFERTR